MNIRSITAVLIAAFVSLLSASRSHAQVLVYRIDISEAKGVNFHTFDGGYFAAPVIGGTGSFLLTSQQAVLPASSTNSTGTTAIDSTTSTSTSGTAAITGATGTSTPGTTTITGPGYTEVDNAGTLFTAVGNGMKKGVITATTGSGTAHGIIVALGDINHSLRIDGPTAALTVQIAPSISGYATSADDESALTQLPADGSIGSAGFAQIKFILDETQTTKANKSGLSLGQTMTQLKNKLISEGYKAAATSSTGSATGTTTDSTTGSTTGTTTGTTTTGTATTGTTTGTTGTTTTNGATTVP